MAPAGGALQSVGHMYKKRFSISALYTGAGDESVDKPVMIHGEPRPARAARQRSVFAQSLGGENTTSAMTTSVKEILMVCRTNAYEERSLEQTAPLAPTAAPRAAGIGTQCTARLGLA